ncbi:MAG: sigma 54-interacting transcriptional regulator [Verrucomicrobia bacterium]|nr:sigma 54-interacting transcriptional regulator [Verrucomicrobiota bacterium]MCF7709129.1 sigma 54-interacting transcriptional regulator [Verrucomicrobiota bacterium]
MNDQQPRSEKELEILYTISHAVLKSSDIPTLLKEILKIIEIEKGFIRGTVTLRMPDSDILVIEASAGLSPREIERGQYKLGEGITGQVAETGKSAIIPDIRREKKFLDRTGSRKNARLSFICVPIIYRKNVIGTFSIDRTPADKDELERDLKFLELVADIIAEAAAALREEIEERESLLAENRRLHDELGEYYRPGNMIGNCSSMRTVYTQVAQVSKTAATVLVRGESGTGKELVARAIHYTSPRADKPFICINCAALPENLVESELFGHEKGAFTGATQQRKGRFELAHKGTLFLDEIGEISPAVQVRLLRVLQERSFERVGGDKTLDVNVRIIAATSKNLEEAVRNGKFREDLYYRLNVFPVYIPPIRERKSDIMLLADHFIKQYSKVYSKEIKRISTAAINMMMSYHWPGNVRELENFIERAVISSTDGVIHAHSLPPSLQTGEYTNTPVIPSDGCSLATMVDSYEREIIVDALKKFNGNAAAAARYLQTTQRILNYRIGKLGIHRERYK